MAYIEMPDIPEPLLKVVTEESWKSAGWTGFREWTVTISIGEVDLLVRTFDDEAEENYHMHGGEAEERTVKEFAERLKEVLAFE